MCSADEVPPFRRGGGAFLFGLLGMAASLVRSGERHLRAGAPARQRTTSLDRVAGLHHSR